MNTPGLFANKTVITVSGCASGIGKTLLCEHIISMVPGIVAIKITMTGAPGSVTDAEDVIRADGKDTCRLKAGGAAHVIWVQSQAECLPDMLRSAEDRVPCGSGTVLIEGNSALAFLTADFGFFVCDARLQSLSTLKPSRVHALSQAHSILLNVRHARTEDTARAASLCRSANPFARILTLNLSDRPAVLQAVAPLLQFLHPNLSAG